MEIRKANVTISAVGGNASKNAKRYGLGIPSAWAQQLEITKDSRRVKLSFDGEKIIIEKTDEEK